MRHARNRSARAVYEMHYGPNMTPMVDVVMVILIFFMASAAILGPEWFLKTSLPVMSAGKKADSQTVRMRISLTRDAGRPRAVITVSSRTDTRPILLSDLEVALEEERREAKGPLQVLIAPDPRTPYEDVVRAHEACAKVGITDVGLPDASEVFGEGRVPGPPIAP